MPRDLARLSNTENKLPVSLLPIKGIAPGPNLLIVNAPSTYRAAITAVNSNGYCFCLFLSSFVLEAPVYFDRRGSLGSCSVDVELWGYHMVLGSFTRTSQDRTWHYNVKAVRANTVASLDALSLLSYHAMKDPHLTVGYPAKAKYNVSKRGMKKKRIYIIYCIFLKLIHNHIRVSPVLPVIYM